jgi:transcriptional regulator NrdR family protein
MKCPSCKSNNTRVKPERYLKENDRTIRKEVCVDCGFEYYVEMKIMDETANR